VATSAVAEDAKAHIEWADCLRGISICVIVFYHATQSLNAVGYPLTAFAAVLRAYIPIVLAGFFLVSGIHGAASLRSDFMTFATRRIWPLLWLLVIWTLIYWVVFAYFPKWNVPKFGQSIWQIPLAILTPTIHLWYLWALIVYLCASWVAVRRGLTTIAIAGALFTFLCLVLTPIQLEQLGLHSLGRRYHWRSAAGYYIVFYIGFRYRREILEWARERAVLLFLMLGVALQIFILGAMSPLTAGLVMLCRAGALVAGLAWTVFASQLLLLSSATAMLFSLLGRQSLVIYLTHLLCVVPLSYLLSSGRWRDAASPLLTTVLLALLGVVLAVAMNRALPLLRLGWLLRAPRLSLPAGTQ
jgi:peptidoglycan/LPS O-acetylase OafA/YrhL